MRFATKAFIASLVLLLATSFVPASWAQINSNTGNVTLTATLPESLTINVNSGAAVNWIAPGNALQSNTAAQAGSTTTSVTTAWVLKPGRTSVAVWAYFGSAAAALVHQTVGNTVDIPSSAVKIQVNGAGAYNPLTVVSPFNAAASGLRIGSSIAITGANKVGSRTDTLAYQIDTTVVPQLPADRYTGTLNIQAQATP